MMHHLRFIITPTYTVHEYISSASVRMNFSGKKQTAIQTECSVQMKKNRLLLLWSRIRLRFDGWHTVPHLKGGHPKQIYPSSLVPLMQYFGRPNWCVHVHTSIHIHTYTYTYCIYIYTFFFAVPTDRGKYIYIYIKYHTYIYIFQERAHLMPHVTSHITLCHISNIICHKSKRPMTYYHISHTSDLISSSINQIFSSIVLVL